tara:strand:- start:63676 stop:64422 length:747 start_codon:yes stop_codon:yes gene_type:complete
MKQRFKLTIEYDGTNYCGWQKQDSLPSVQGSIQNALKNFCQNEVTIFGAGRTDSGVHAKGQVAHLDIKKECDNTTLLNALNYYLNNEPISILSVDKVDSNFDARFSAIKRYYEYIIINRASPLTFGLNTACHINKKLDIIKMKESAKSLIGMHDFTTFRSANCQSKSPIKAIDEINFNQNNEKLSIQFIAKSYLHTQIRSIVGSIIKVGNGDWEPQKIKQIMEAKDREQCAKLAPACGLYLSKIDYPK